MTRPVSLVIAYARCGDPVRNLQRIAIQSTPQASENPKTANTTCPEPTRLYGLGAEITGGLGNVVLDDLTPTSTLTGINVTAYETGTYNGNWRLTGYAICAP